MDWDYSSLWEEAMNQLRSELTVQEFTMWFTSLQYRRSEEQKIIVSAPSNFYRDQVIQRYMNEITGKLHELLGARIELDFEILNPPPPDTSGPTRHVRASQPSGSEATGSSDAEKLRGPVERPNHPSLNPRYTFDNFVIGHNNSFAANAAQAIAKNPGMTYNPFLIYGGVGLGKTHLLQSIGNAVFREFDNLKIVYVNMEQFIDDFVRSIKEKRTQKFKSKYRYADVLLIDDIHFIQGKTETQEELFHTFNALYEANKHMIFTCDRPVSELRDLTDRLTSRLDRGLRVDLQPPSFETRFAILKLKIEAMNRSIPDDVLNVICNKVTTNVRDLEAALTKIIAYADLVNKDITPEVAQQQLQDIFARYDRASVSINLIQRVVADYFALSTADLKGKKRNRAIAHPRQIAMYIVREITEYSTTEVGLEFGGRDHTTVMHACQRIESRMRSDPTLEGTIQLLIREIREQNSK